MCYDFEGYTVRISGRGCWADFAGWMTHSGPSITSIQQILRCEFFSGLVLARTRNFADVISMARCAASDYFVGKSMPGGWHPIVHKHKLKSYWDESTKVACVDLLPSISSDTTGLLVVLLVNGAYLQMFMAMIIINVLRSVRHCPTTALHTPPTAVSSTFISSFIRCGIFRGLHCFACCTCLLCS